MRRRARIDSNQNMIVDTLRKCGYSVAVTSSLGDGFPDIVVGANGLNFLFEIKDPGKPKSARKLTEEEEKFKERWKGQYKVIESSLDVINEVNKSYYQNHKKPKHEQKNNCRA